MPWKMEFGTEEYLAVCNYPIVEEGGSCKGIIRTGEKQKSWNSCISGLPTVPGVCKTGNEGFSHDIPREYPGTRLPVICKKGRKTEQR